MKTMRRAVSGCLAAAAGLAVMAIPARTLPLRAERLGQDAQNDVTIVLSNPAYHPRLGLPDFVVPSGDPELAAAMKTVADVLWNDLDFEREYYLIPRASSAAIPVSPASALPFPQWTEIGADFVLAGSATRHGSEVAIELRMIAVRGDQQGHQAFGARYPNCTVQNARYCAHAIADDFHKQTRGLDGVARTKLAFSSDRDAARVPGRPSQTQGQGKEIYISDYDGANQTRFTVNRHLNIGPAWAPVGGRLAYTSWMAGPPDIYVANLAQPGRGLSRPAAGSLAVQNWLPAWSPDGKKLAFASTRSGNLDIWVVNSDGSGLVNLTNSPGIDSAPTWSPDGNKIAFTSDRAGSKQLWVMSATGTGMERLVAQQIDRPTWSRLNFIAFTVGSGPGYDIGIYDFGNPGVRVLTDGRGKNESPAIAPNGRHIAFVTSRWGKEQIAMIDLTGGPPRQITQSGNNDYPNWGPIPQP
jgi:TolB protein